MIDAQRRNGEPAFFHDRAFSEFVECDQFPDVGPAFILDAYLDVEIERLAEAAPTGFRPRRAENLDRRREPGGPCGVEKGAEFQHMVRVQMRDEDEIERLQRHAGIDKAFRHAEPAIHHDAAAADLQKRGGRHGTARPYRRAALAAEKDEPFGHDQSPSGVPLKRFFSPDQQSM